jgi:hypothetical protein
MLIFITMLLVYGGTFIGCNGKLDTNKKVVGFIILAIVALLMVLLS